ncbi:NUDIX domain-containing protein [archaeon]|nr:NUDIX domain-containing protein [archaeon]
MIYMINSSQTKLGCGALIINNKNEILLLQRPYAHTNEPGFWTRPGRKIEIGESPKDATLREVKE